MTSRLPRVPDSASSPDAQGDASPATRVADMFDTLRHAMREERHAPREERHAERQVGAGPGPGDPGRSDAHFNAILDGIRTAIDPTPPRREPGFTRHPPAPPADPLGQLVANVLNDTGHRLSFPHIPHPDTGDTPSSSTSSSSSSSTSSSSPTPQQQEPDFADILDTIKRDAQEENSRYHATAAATAAASQRDASRAVRQRPQPARQSHSYKSHPYRPRPFAPPSRQGNGPGLSMLALLLLAGIAMLSLIALIAWLSLRPDSPRPAPPSTRAQPFAPPPQTAQPQTAPPQTAPPASPSPAPQPAQTQPQPEPAPQPAPIAASPPLAAADLCDGRFARVAAGFSVRREELLPFIDDDAALMACRRAIDWQDAEHLAIWGVASLLRAYPAPANAADLFAAACDKGGRVGCAWSAVWPQGGPYPVRDAQDMLRRLEPFLDGALPVADTTAALALLRQRQPTDDDIALATALLDRAASAGDIWAAHELTALPER